MLSRAKRLQIYFPDTKQIELEQEFKFQIKDMSFH